MPYADPTAQREAMARTAQQRKRAMPLYRALLRAYLDPELSPRLYRMVRAPSSPVTYRSEHYTHRKLAKDD